MQRAVSTYLYVKERLHPGILDGLARSGVQAIEIFAARQHLDYANRKQHVKEIAEWFRIWLEMPDGFFHWLEVRKAAPEFRGAFGQFETEE